jgi:hypothetical protein
MLGYPIDLKKHDKEKIEKILSLINEEFLDGAAFKTCQP